MKTTTDQSAKNEGAREALDRLEDRLLRTNERSVFIVGNYLIQSYPERKIYGHMLVEIKRLIDEIRKQYQ